MPITRAELRSIAEVLKPRLKALKDEAVALRQRLDALEQRPELKWAGTYRAGESYGMGSLVSRSGGLWLAERPTSALPGNGDSGWRLVVKSGRAE